MIFCQQGVAQESACFFSNACWAVGQLGCGFLQLRPWECYKKAHAQESESFFDPKKGLITHHDPKTKGIDYLALHLLHKLY